MPKIEHVAIGRRCPTTIPQLSVAQVVGGARRPDHDYRKQTGSVPTAEKPQGLSGDRLEVLQSSEHMESAQGDHCPAKELVCATHSSIWKPEATAIQGTTLAGTAPLGTSDNDDPTRLRLDDPQGARML
jgi:hypothetical protein